MCRASTSPPGCCTCSGSWNICGSRLSNFSSSTSQDIVNANRRHYEAAAKALAQADADWLARLITRRVPLDHWREALKREPHDIKVVVELGATA